MLDHAVLQKYLYVVHGPFCGYNLQIYVDKNSYDMLNDMKIVYCPSANCPAAILPSQIDFFSCSLFQNVTFQ